MRTCARCARSSKEITTDGLGASWAPPSTPTAKWTRKHLCAHLGVEESNAEDDAYTTAFIEGAQEVFEEVKDQI
jgi:hypothetical protein